MVEESARVLDCDVHCAPSTIGALLPYLDPYWHEYIAGSRLGLSNTVAGAYPQGALTSAVPDARQSGTFPPSNYDDLRKQVLVPNPGTDVILNCITSFNMSRNESYETAFVRAVNDWVRTEWLDRDERLHSSMVVSTLDPEAAVEEIERLGPDRRFVQVLLPVRSDVPYGSKRFHSIYEAAERHDLVVGLHAWGRVGNAPTATGFTHTYLEDSLSNSQSIVQTQIVSMVVQGVFERFPRLRVALVECGFSWLPPLLWRVDKAWKALWREVPWLRARPSEYVYEHFRATTAPAHLPTNRDAVAEVAEMLRADDFLMFSSDYPHYHGNDFERLLDVLDDAGREAVMHENATAFYRRARQQ